MSVSSVTTDVAPTQGSPAQQVADVLRRLDADLPHDVADGIDAVTPIDGSSVGRVPVSADADEVVARAAAAYAAWRRTPAPVRGAVVRELGLLLREHKEDLATLVTVEAGKIVSEGRGEVQEMIDICDLAVGLSRQLHGATIVSERPEHRMMEQWHPLGVVGVITAFNFPVAVWAWNAALALVAGDTVVWKPSEKAPLTAWAVHAIARRAAGRVGADPDIVQLIIGDSRSGEALVDDPRVALVSATGSSRMGRAVGPRVAHRFGRVLLELGGNNAAVVAPSADLDLTVRALAFAAAGTAGQRCTTLRRVIAHESIVDELVERLAAAYRSLPVGDPRVAGTLVGPLIDAESGRAVTAALRRAHDDGGHVVAGGDVVDVPGCDGGTYLRPALVRMPSQTDIVRDETFGPVLYVLGYRDLDEAIALQNDVPQGLSSAIFTTDLREAETFCSVVGSDCGIANINIGPSGAEIGGAFGGEKETGGGRESGSDAWKAYMRRTTNTINYGRSLPMAQGVEFL